MVAISLSNSVPFSPIAAVRNCPSGALSYAIGGVECRDEVDQVREPMIVVSNHPGKHRSLVLATCGIHRHELGCESSSFCLLLLADSPEAEYNLKH